MRKFGLLGFPLSHSFSRKYFTEKFNREGIDAVFDNYSLEALDTLPSIVAADRIEGFAITIPHKRNILPLLQWRSPEVIEMNACNCVRVDGNRWSGYNTDVTGFEKSFLPLKKDYHDKALVLGTGGAAAAVQYVLNKLGIAFKTVSRTHNDDHLAYSDLDAAVMDSYKVIINCSPVGTYPAIGECPAIPYALITPEHYLYDLIYNPEETLFLQHGKEKKATIKNGYEMLMIQAEENWKIWNA